MVVPTRQRRVGLVASVAICLGVAACSNGSATSTSSSLVPPTSSVGTSAAALPSSASSPAVSGPLAFTGQDEVAWEYSGDNGPDHWGNIAPGCDPGSSGSQSPIDIDSTRLITAAPPTDGALTINYVPTEFDVENTGRTIEAVPHDLENNFITIDEEKFYLLQFHLHNPSEHTIDNAAFDLELHLVNKSDDGALAVLGILMNADQENAALAELFEKVPTTKTDEHSSVALDEKIDPTELIPAASKVARYSGSLTTPPCTEPVIWSVFLTPSAVSDSQLAALAGIFPGSHRPTQPLNGRTITEVSSTIQ